MLNRRIPKSRLEALKCPKMFTVIYTREKQSERERESERDIHVYIYV